MSRAFTREQDDEPSDIGERPISEHRNLVTPEGLRMIEAEAAALREELAKAGADGDREKIALISRDLRFRTITLYLARPMRRSVYVLVRLASLAVATFILIGAPLLLMYVGGLLADLPPGRETGRFLGAIVGAALLAACLSGLAALVAALTIRRGLAVTAVIVVLLVSYTVVSTIQGIAVGAEQEAVGEVAGLFSPYTLVNGLQVYLFGSPEATPTPPTSDAMGILYVVATLLTVLGSIGALMLRYRKVSP